MFLFLHFNGTFGLKMTNFPISIPTFTGQAKSMERVALSVLLFRRRRGKQPLLGLRAAAQFATECWPSRAAVVVVVVVEGGSWSDWKCGRAGGDCQGHSGKIGVKKLLSKIA